MRNKHLFEDMMQRWIRLPEIPQRIVSTVPSQTELLYHLGLDQTVLGITKFCVHPKAWNKTKTIVGGTKKLNLVKIQKLCPDLVIANKEENTEADIRAIEQFCPVWISDIRSVEDNYLMVQKIGEMLGCKQQAIDIISATKQALLTNNIAETRPKVAYLIWRKPWMSVGQDTYIHDVIQKLGWDNVFKHQYRYPVVCDEGLKEASPEFLLLSSEPYPFRAHHISELQKLLPQTKILLVDGELFSWYGSRITQAGDYFKSLQLAISTAR